jgi:hypothetical protein
MCTVIYPLMYSLLIKCPHIVLTNIGEQQHCMYGVVQDQHLGGKIVFSGFIKQLFPKIHVHPNSTGHNFFFHS